MDYGNAFETGGTSDWFHIEDAQRYDGDHAHSGPISHNEQTLTTEQEEDVRTLLLQVKEGVRKISKLKTDSGLDVDALRSVAEGINKLKTPKTSVLLITHYQRILTYIKPDTVHIMSKGKIVKSGSHELAEHIEKKGYELVE